MLSDSFSLYQTEFPRPLPDTCVQARPRLQNCGGSLPLFWGAGLLDGDVLVLRALLGAPGTKRACSLGGRRGAGTSTPVWWSECSGRAGELRSLQSMPY